MMRLTGNALAPLVFAALGALYSGSAAAQYYSSGGQGRAQTWEWWGEVRFIFGKDVSFDHGSSISTSDDAGFGLGFGYNIDEHWLASFEFQYNELQYKANITSADTPPKASANLTGTAQISRFGGSIAYNLLPGPLTPYVVGTLGWSWVDSNIPTGPPQTGCWWDPWYGYLCSTWQATASGNAFTYGLGAGVLWDAGHRFFVRFGYEYDWVDFSHSSSTPGFSLLRLQFGSRF
jgi:opacity protein-like surface antigen